MEEIEPPSSRREWGRADFAVPDFEFAIIVPISTTSVDRSSSGRIPPEASSGPQTRPTRQENLWVNRCVELSSPACPFCGGGHLTQRPDGRLVRLAFDLQKTRSGSDDGSPAHDHLALMCELWETVSPREYLRVDEHGHTLKSWAMYEHIVHRASFASIAERIKTYFGLPVFTPDIRTFKRR